MKTHQMIIVILLSIIGALVASRCHGAEFDFSTPANPQTQGGITVALTPEPVYAEGWIEDGGFMGATGFWDLARGHGLITCPAGIATLSITAYEWAWSGPVAYVAENRVTNFVDWLGGQWVTSTYTVPTLGTIAFTNSPGLGLIIDRLTVSVAEPAPQLSIASVPTVSVSWSGNGWTLQRKVIGGEWQPVATNSPAVLPAVDNAIFKLTR